MDKGRESRADSAGQADQGNHKDRAAHTNPVSGWLPGLLAGAAFLYIGAVRGELAVIWQKAVMICMECIGIG